jgi:hypothetical protein
MQCRRLHVRHGLVDLEGAKIFVVHRLTLSRRPSGRSNRFICRQFHLKENEMNVKTALLGKALLLVAMMAMGATVARASSLTFSCDPTVDATQAGTCAYLNSTISNLYTSTFTNVNASIYIQMGTTALGENTTGLYNDVSFSTYLADLTATASSDTVDVDALAALNSVDNPLYGSDNVVITSALGQALGIPDASLVGTTAGGSTCVIGTSGCYNGIITITTPANLASETGGTQGLYWNQTGGTQPINDYDFYSVVENETDEILGTGSCVTTATNPLSDPCSSVFGASTPSAADLFRYSAPGALIPDSAPSTTPGAYFSYNGGATNGADGADYNTLDNGENYSDFTTNCQHVQDATGCLGSDLNISTDGGSEINILDAVGYNANNANTVNPMPEPSGMALLITGLLGIGMVSRKRRFA